MCQQTAPAFNEVCLLGLNLTAVRWKHVRYTARHLDQTHADVIASKLHM